LFLLRARKLAQAKEGQMERQSKATHFAELLEPRRLLAVLSSFSLVYDRLDLDTPQTQRLDFVFDTDMSSSLQAPDLTLNNATRDTFLTGATLEFSNGGKTASFRFPNSVGDHTAHAGVLPDGYYRASLTKEDVPSLDHDEFRDFDFIAGDTDGNGSVNFDDYVRTDNGYNNGLKGYLNGDFNYTVVVNFDDYVIIDQSFNTHWQPPPPGPGAVSVFATSFDTVHLNWVDNVAGEAGWRVRGRMTTSRPQPS
jgi:hypothetical protein